MTDTQINRVLTDAEGYRKQCICLATKICGSARDGEEIFSDALRLLWEKDIDLPPQKLKAYLYRAVRNLSLKRLEEKSAHKRSFDGLAAASDREQADFFSVESELDANELSRLIGDWLMTQKKDDRKVFVCRCYYRMSVSETARHLKISESKVKVSLMRSRERLKLLIKHYGEEI